MIYYFSGTGNSRFVAEKIAKLLNDTVISIVDAVKNKKDIVPLKENENLGIVFPIYAWSPPDYVIKFVKKLKRGKNNFTFVVMTCESQSGIAHWALKPFIRIDSAYAIAMPNNYVMWGIGNNADLLCNELPDALSEIRRIVEEVSEKKKKIRILFAPFPLLSTFVIAPLFKLTRCDRKFYADEKCIGCGKCAKTCPIEDIKIVDGKPLWLHKHCMHCTACINRCPQQAIQYGQNTKYYGRYEFPFDKRL